MKQQPHTEIPQKLLDIGLDIYELISISKLLNTENSNISNSYEAYVLNNILIILKTEDTDENKRINIRFFIDWLLPLQ